MRSSPESAELYSKSSIHVSAARSSPDSAVLEEQERLGPAGLRCEPLSNFPTSSQSFLFTLHVNLIRPIKADIRSSRREIGKRRRKTAGGGGSREKCYTRHVFIYVHVCINGLRFKNVHVCT
jgi:hypothetical protein